MNIIKDIFYKEDDVFLTCRRFIRALGVKITDDTVKQTLESHPDYPSLLSLTDTLTNLNIPNLTLKVSSQELGKIPLPFIAILSKEDDVFTIVQEVTDSHVKYISRNNKQEVIPISDFISEKGMIITFAEVENIVAEESFETKKAQEKLRKILGLAAIFFFPLFAVVSIVLFWFAKISDSLVSIHQILAILGFSVSITTILYDLNITNPSLRKLCGMPNDVSDCSKVIGSSAGNFWGVSWGVIGSSYFFINSLWQAVFQALNHKPSIIPFQFSIIAGLFILYSLYYQWKVIRKWCRLCLIVQTVLAAQLALSLNTVFYKGFDVSEAMAFIMLGSLWFLMFYFLVNYLRKNRLVKEEISVLKKLKNKPEVFLSVLKAQNKIVTPSFELGIFIGNPNAKYRMIKVCNPYCGPCSKSHNEFISLIEDNDDVSLQIIFTASNNPDDPSLHPVKLFMAIAETRPTQETIEVLNLWYNNPFKDFAAFSKKYPNNKVKDSNNENVEAMFKWCTKNNIRYTPTYFLNDYELPDDYSIRHVKYLLYKNLDL